MKFRSVLLAACCLGGFLGVATPIVAGQDKSTPPKLVTVTYNVADILERKSFQDHPLTGKQMDNPGEGLLASLLEGLVQNHPESAKKFLDQKPQFKLNLLGGKTLEVHADKNTHDQVKALLETIRLADVSLVIESWLIEVERGDYDKEIAGKLNRLPGSPAVFADPATDEFELKLRNAQLPKPYWVGRKPLHSNEVVLQNGEGGEIFSWKTPVRYITSFMDAFGQPEANYAYPGFSLMLKPGISQDRRKTHLQLTLKVNQLLQWQKQKTKIFLPTQEFKELDIDVPVLHETTSTRTLEAFDGWPVAVEIPWQKPGAAADGSRLLLVFTVRIRIEGEERWLQKELEKGKK